MSSPSESRAVLRGAVPPSEENRRRLLDFLRQTYDREFTLEWEQDDTLTGGFVLQVGTDIYDWSVEGRLRQFREEGGRLKHAGGNVISLVKEVLAPISRIVISLKLMVSYREAQALMISSFLAFVNSSEPFGIAVSPFYQTA